MPLTLADIAKQAGVSVSTVSRVINAHPNVSARARAKVLAVTEQLNFQPNAAARTLAAGRSQILGLVIPTGVPALFTDPYFPILVQGVAEACNAQDHSVMLWLPEPEHERAMMQRILHGGMMDGVIIASMLMDDPLVEALLQQGRPFVLVGRHPTETRISYVEVENRASSQEMVAYLFRLGYRRIATITGPRNMIAGSDRLEGYQAAVRARGLIPDPALIANGEFTEAGAYTAMQRLLTHAPDAVFCASDTMAVGAMRAIREAGKRVPEDIAIAGFDDLPLAAHTDPPLTTVRQPIQRMGALAVQTLIDLIANPGSAPRRIILPTEMVIRDSCGTGIP